MAEKKETKSLEETFQGIEEIIERMEQPDVSLEDSFAVWFVIPAVYRAVRHLAVSVIFGSWLLWSMK